MTDQQEVLELTPEFVAICNKHEMSPITALNELQKVVIYLDLFNDEIDLAILDKIAADFEAVLK